KELEGQGVYLAVSELNVRYRAAARYDDLVQVRCWVRELASRRVTFGYAVERAGTGELLATGVTSLVSLTHQHTVTRMPQHVLDPLITALGDSAPAVQAAAAFALGLLKQPRAIAALLAFAPVQPEAVTAIAKTGGDESAAALTVLLGSGASATAVQRAALLE